MAQETGTLLSLAETASRLGATTEIVRYLISEGELRGHRLAGQWCVFERDLEYFLAHWRERRPGRREPTYASR
jgi:excisionase family DNA binding protein